MTTRSVTPCEEAQVEGETIEIVVQLEVDTATIDLDVFEAVDEVDPRGNPPEVGSPVPAQSQVRSRHVFSATAVRPSNDGKWRKTSSNRTQRLRCISSFVMYEWMQ